jgi:23S rRNA (cytosine1962-C5)-methyltransferase
MDTQHPTLRLKPKADARRIRHGFPWVYGDDLVLDRRSRALAPGAIAVLEDSERAPLGLCAANIGTRIVARVLDPDPEARIDADWFRAKVTAALELRTRLFDTPFYRLIHAEADGLPGVIVDRFDTTLVLQPNTAWAEANCAALAAALVDVTGCTSVFKNAQGRARVSEGLDEENADLIGTAPDRVTVPMNGALYIADLKGGQKTGLFYDQRPNHAFAAQLAKGARVLDVFSHVGGFGLAALAGGAAQALAVDGSAPALMLAEEGAAAMGRAADFSTLKGDAFDVMTTLAEEGRTFDLVVADPPAFAPSKQALSTGLRAYERAARLAATLVAPGGTVVLCSCSHAAELAKFRASCVRGMGRAGRSGALIYTGFAGPDHPIHPQLAETGYLKVLAFRCT